MPLPATATTVSQHIATPLESLLGDDKRGALINYLDQRITSIRGSLSNYVTKRKEFELQMNDNFDWRGGGRARGRYSSEGLDEWANSIFDLQNDTLNIVGGFAAFMTARTVDDIFGTEPFYAVSPEGLADDLLAQTLQKHSEWKLRKSEWKEAALAAIEYAVGIGEGVIKSAWVRDVDVFEVRKTILFDIRNKAPVSTIDGQYVFQEDVTPGTAIDPVTGQPIMTLAVTKDPSLILNVADMTWQEMEIEQTNVSYDNVQSHVMHYGDVLISENEPNVKGANFVGHRHQKRVSELRAKYQLDETTLSILLADNTTAKTEAAKQQEDEAGEQEPMQDNPDPIIELVECWVKYDPVGDGRLRRMYIDYAVRDKLILSMDYIANVTPEGALPFHVVRAYPVKNRWYGRGYFEIYAKAQEFIDRHLNYVAYRNRFHSNPAKFFDPSLLLEDEESDDDWQLTPGSTMRKKPGVKSEDVLSFVEFPDLDERTWQLMQMMIQVVQVRSGITSAAQGEVSSLPSTATATGIESILQSASTLARMPIGFMKNGLEASLLYAIKLIYANMNVDEVYSYFEGDSQKTGTLQASIVKDLDMNVRLLLTRFKQRENLESAEKAITLVTTQYLPLPEPEKIAVRPLFVQAVKGLGFDQADTIVRAPVLGLPPPPAQPGAAQPAGGAPALNAPPPQNG